MVSKIYIKNTYRESNCLDSDKDRHSFGPDLGPNCLQMTKVAASKERVNQFVPRQH